MVLAYKLLLLTMQASCIGNDATVTLINVNNSMQQAVMELTRERGDLDMKRMHAENELRQCQHARQSLELEKDILQRDVAALQTQLDDRSEGLRQSWKDANAKASAVWPASEHEVQFACLSHLVTQLDSSKPSMAAMHEMPTCEHCGQASCSSASVLPSQGSWNFCTGS